MSNPLTDNELLALNFEDGVLPHEDDDSASFYLCAADEQILMFARAVERAAYERAAQACEAHSDKAREYSLGLASISAGYLCADAIRALKGDAA